MNTRPAACGGVDEQRMKTRGGKRADRRNHARNVSLQRRYDVFRDRRVAGALDDEIRQALGRMVELLAQAGVWSHGQGDVLGAAHRGRSRHDLDDSRCVVCLKQACKFLADRSKADGGYFEHRFARCVSVR